jgi:membrane associated rhomboid family serine protease
MGLVYFGIEIFSAIQNSAGDNVARWAHIGGGLVGFLLVITWNKKNRRNFY